MFEIRKSTNGQFYFVLKSTNGEVIATSEMYVSKQGCENGIAAVKRIAATAATHDTTVSSSLGW